MNVIRNLLLAAAAAVPVGAGVGSALSPVNLPSPTPIPLPTGPITVTPSPTPFTSPTVFAPPPPPGGTGGGGPGSSGVIVDLNTLGTFCTPLEPDLNATIDLENQVFTYRTSIGKPVADDQRLDALAQVDTLAIIPAVIPSTTRAGKTIIQRVKASIPTAKNAAEIIVKGCFPTGNTPAEIMALILANPPNPNTVAIMNNPNWTNVGVNVMTDLSFGGVIYIIIFAQE